MSMWLALQLVGCSTAPSAVEIVGGDERIVVHELGAIELPRAVAVDDEGRVVDVGEPIVWMVEPEGVARLGESGLELVADGTATLTARLGTLEDAVVVEVSLPDELRIDSSALDGAAIGAPVALGAVVRADGAALLGRPIVWSVSDPAIASITEHGELTFTAPGTVVVTATSGELSETVELTVAASDAPTQM